jgi:hypothetical protein
MNPNRKKAPGRLTRAIVALAASTGKKLTWIRNNDRVADAARDRAFNPATEDSEGYVKLNERTTITVETERLLVVRSKRRRLKLSDHGRPTRKP